MVNKFLGVRAACLRVIRDRKYGSNMLFGEVRQLGKNSAKRVVRFVDDRSVVGRKITRQGAFADLSILVADFDAGDIGFEKSAQTLGLLARQGSPDHETAVHVGQLQISYIDDFF